MQSAPVVVLTTLAAQREGLATNDDIYTKYSQSLDDLQELKIKVNQSLEESKLSLQAVKDQIGKLKCQQESLIKKQEKKRSRLQWLTKQRDSKFGDSAELEQFIEETEEAVNKLSKKIDELEQNIKELGKQAKQREIQLSKQEKEKHELQQRLKEVQERKESLEIVLEKDRRHYQKEIDSVIMELKLREV